MPSERGQAALDLWDAGFNPLPAFVPVGDGKCECRKADCKSPGKHPRVQWKIYIDRRPTRDEVLTWWTRWPQANISLMTGQGLAVLDIDPRNGGDVSLKDLEQKFGPLPTTVSAITGGGGWHYYFRYGPDEEPDSVEIAPGVEIKAKAHAVMAPPSIHSSGKRYEWDVAVDPALENCIAMPDWMHIARPTNEKGEPQKNVEGWVDEALKGAKEGQRHILATKLAGYWLRQGQSNVDVLRALKLWDEKNEPPLGETHLREVVRDLAAKESESRNARQNFSIDKITKINYNEPYYVVEIFGVAVKLKADDLLTWSMFVKRVAERADRVPSLKDPNKNWRPMLDDLFANKMTITEVPGDANADEALWITIASTLHGKSREDEMSLASFGMYSNEEYYYVKSEKLLKMVHDKGPAYSRIQNKDIWECLRDKAAARVEKEISGEGQTMVVPAWQIPKAWVASAMPRAVEPKLED